MKIRAVLIVKGEVQRVGYRDVVGRIARKMNLNGYVENIEPYDVKIVVEGEKDAVDAFIEQIKIKDERIDVESIDATYGESTNEFTFFKIRRGDLVEEMGERFDRANYDLEVLSEKQTETIYILKENNNILTCFRDETNNNFTTLNSKYHLISDEMKSLREDIHKLTEAMITIAQASLGSQKARQKSGRRQRKSSNDLRGIG